MPPPSFVSSAPVLVRASSELDANGTVLSIAPSTDAKTDRRTCGCSLQSRKTVISLPIFVCCQALTLAVIISLGVLCYRSVEENKRRINEMHVFVYKHCVSHEIHEVSPVIQPQVSLLCHGVYLTADNIILTRKITLPVLDKKIKNK